MSKEDFSRLFTQLEALSIGFGPMFRDFQVTTSHYPPHNIFHEGNKIILELAVAGFKKNELDIREEQGELSIQGIKSENQDEPEYIHRGIAGRHFVKRFKISDEYKQDEARLEDGILTLTFLKTKPKDIKIITIK